MKKLIIILLSIVAFISVSGCSNKIDFGKELDNMIKNEIQYYLLKEDVNNKGSYTNEFTNDMAASVLVLENYKTINLKLVLSKIDKDIDEIKSYYETKDINSIYDVFNMLLVYHMLEIDLDRLIDYCEELTITDLTSYDYVTAINCLSILDDKIEDNTELKAKLVSKISDISTLDYIDSDVASMIILTYQGRAPKAYIDYIFENISNEGYVNGFGDKASSSSMSQVVCALISEGYSYGNNIVTKALFDFKTSIGFKNLLTDETGDLAYASPQAFKAISATYVFEKTGKKPILY